MGGGYKTNILKYFNPNLKSENFIKYILSKIGLLEYLKKKKASKDLKKLKTHLFVTNYCNVKEAYNQRQYNRLIEKTDIFITGSDQIWNVWFQFNPFYFLDFAKDKKRIAYASSIGTNSFPSKYEKQIRFLLNKFAHIAVREKSAVKTINNLLGENKCIQVVDPTFLLTSSEWETVASKANIEIHIPNEYILCHFIGNNCDYSRQVKAIKEKSKIKDIIIIPSLENPQFSIEGATIYNYAGPAEFVSLIKQAKLVCTDSFHATAISINLSVDFIEFKRFKDTDEASQNSRIYDLLEHYNLNYRLYDDNNDAWLTSIDYTRVSKVLKKDREYSIEYLKNAIEN